MNVPHTFSTIAFLVCFVPAVLTPVSSRAAVVVYTADAWDADSDISNLGILVSALNMGSSTAVTAGGVVFGADTGNFFVTGATDASGVSDFYNGGAIGSLSSGDAQTLLDSLEFGALTVGNSLMRFTGLTVGWAYEFQLIVADDRAGSSAYTANFGYSSPSGNATETYGLTGIDFTSNSPYVITGSFIADENAQDIHMEISSTTLNGQINAYQIRTTGAAPEPSRALLLMMGLGTMIVRRRRA